MKDYTKHGQEKQFRAVDQLGLGWVVIDRAGAVVGQGYSNSVRAGAAAGVMNKKARRASTCTPRACMTCHATFDSEGIHNRICPDCKHLTSHLDPYAVGIGHGLRRR